MSDIDNELLDLAGEGTDTETKNRKRKISGNGFESKKKYKSSELVNDDDDDETEDDLPPGHSTGALNAEEDEDEDDMDIDLESEDGYEERRPIHEPFAPTTGRSSPGAISERDSEELEDIPTKSQSSSKKPKPKEKKVPVPKGRAVKRKAPVSKASRDEPVALESRNPYPLEGKFKDEEDRDYLLGLPEIEREEIIASRLEEHQKHLDQQQLAALFNRTNPGEAPSRIQDPDEDAEGEEDMEMDMDIDQDSDEEQLGRGATRSKTTSEPKSKALDKLTERRKARNERANNKTSAPKTRRRSDDSDAESYKSEGSEYGAVRGKTTRRGRSADVYSDAESDFDKGGRNRNKTKQKRDDLPADLETLNKVRLTRVDLAEYKHRSFFETMIKGAYVRCIAGQDERKQPKYRLFQIAGLTGEERKYEIEHRGKSIPENRRLQLKYGKATRPFRMAEVSNSPFTDAEYRRWKATMDADEVNLPFRTDLEEKAVKLEEFRNRNVTDEDIQARLSAMQKLGAGRPNAKEEEILKSELSLAHRRNDMVAVKALQVQLVDMQNVRKAQEDGEVSVDVMAGMLAKVNERSRRTVQESHKRAFKVETERKRLALGDFKGKIGVDTPSPRGSPAPIPSAMSGQPVDLTKNDDARILETKTGDVAVELDLGDF